VVRCVKRKKVQEGVDGHHGGAVVIKFEDWITCDANVQNCETPSMQREVPHSGKSRHMVH
jgi:hypothetical protein